MDQNVVFELTRSEAIVLDSLLARLENDQSIKFEDKAEEYVLWSLQAILDKKLYETFDLDFPKILDNAREQVRKNY